MNPSEIRYLAENSEAGFAVVQDQEQVFGLLRLPWQIIFNEEGENDGLVPFHSAMWREKYFVEKIDADHLNQIGWWDRGEAITGVDREGFERKIRGIYLKIAMQLRDNN